MVNGFSTCFPLEALHVTTGCSRSFRIIATQRILISGDKTNADRGNCSRYLYIFAGVKSKDNKITSTF